MKKTFLLSIFAALSLSAADTISGAGASFPAPLYYDWAHSYNQATGIQVNYQSIGSGGGIKQIAARTVDFGATDAPLEVKDQEKMKVYQFPAVIGAIAVAYNLPELKGKELKLSNEVIEGIFMGEITTWNDPKIAKDNKGVKLPSKPINLVHRSDGSGTTWNFTYWLDKISAKWHEKIGLGKTVEWPVGMGGKGNEGVANMMKQTPGSIGYLETAFVKQNNLEMATLQSAEKTWVKATPKTMANAAANARWKASEGFYEVLALEPGKQTYPITAATFILLPKEKAEQDKKVTAFYNYGFDKGDAAAEKLGYIALPKVTTDAINAYWKANGIK
jgi:phosphate transport system substrate-binding protein